MISTAVINATRGSSWSGSEVRALIAMWGELDGAVRNQAIFNSIAKNMTKIVTMDKRVNSTKN